MGGNPDLNVAIRGFFRTIGGGSGTQFGKNSYTILDNLVRQSGRHSIKLGGEVRYLQGARVDRDPKYTVNYNTPDEFLANRVDEVIITFGNDGRGLRHANYGFFFQDDFKAHPRLTLNLGVRYEYLTVLREHHGRVYNVVSAPDGPYRKEGEPGYSPDRNNWGPRAGFAWMATRDQKTVLRGGVGVYSAPLPLWYLYYNIMNPELPFRTSILRTHLPGGLSYPLLPNIDQLAKSAGVLSRYAWDPKIRDNYSEQWSLNMQRQLMKDTAVMVGYAGNRALKVPQTRQLNLSVPELGGRANPALGSINYYEGADMSVHHALQTTVRRRLAGGLYFDAYYTYCKTMVNGASMPGNNGRDFDNLRADRAVGNLDVAHVFHSDFSYDLPVGPGKLLLGSAGGLTRHLVEGRQIAGILGLRSGAALHVISGRDIRGNQAGTQRPNLVPGVPVTPANQSRNNYVKRGAFVLPPAGQFGSLGRNLLRGPSGSSIDLSAYRNFRLSERVRMQFRSEFFSIFNCPVWGNPTVSLASGSFGIINRASGNREIQFALKIMF